MSKIYNRCNICNGIGLVRSIPIKCKFCDGNPRGCIGCICGYTKVFWEPCTKCFETGLKMPFSEYVKLLHK